LGQGVRRRLAPTLTLPFALTTQLRQWAAQEIAADRLLPWLAIAYGFGVVIYFSAEREPAWWAATTLAAICGFGAIMLRRHLVVFIIGLFVFAIAAGFAAATVKTAMIEHPVLHYPASGETIAGFVELREASRHTDPAPILFDSSYCGAAVPVKPVPGEPITMLFW
jgi:competence protein ComEC